MNNRIFWKRNLQQYYYAKDALENLNLKDEIDKFKKPTKPKFLEKKEQNKLTFNNIDILFEGRQKVLDGFESKIFLKEQQAQGNGRFSGIASHLKIKF